jgi:RNA polymerase sigma-70 factor (ECF subfamily)
VSVESPAVALDFEAHRAELTGYCYRMLGSTFDADDAVQETMVRAWQAADSFEGRSSVRSWLYRIATNVCLDSLRSRQRRALPMDLSAPVPSTTLPEKILPENTWIEPIPDADLDPAEHAVAQDTIRIAFIAALQHLPPKQRAVLILREVLAWQATEVAELLETSVASVNSALQRARATLSEHEALESSRASALDATERELLTRYVAAFESYDIDALVKLLHEDAGFSMPPFEMWIQGVDQIHDFYLGHGIACKDSHLVPLVANNTPAFGHYKRADDGVYRPWAIQVIEISDGRVSHLHHFIDFDTKLFARFGLPPTFEG